MILTLVGCGDFWRRPPGGAAYPTSQGEDGRGKGEDGKGKTERRTEVEMRKHKWVGCELWRFDGERWVPNNGSDRKQIRSYRDLDVFNLAYTLAMEVFRLTTRFPKEERYALVDQMRRSSRGVCGNIVEGFAKRRYEAVFKNALNDSLGESEETKPCPEPVEGSGWTSLLIASMLQPTSTRASPLATGKSAPCSGPL